MLLAFLDTLDLITEDNFRASHPTLVFPAGFDGVDLSEYGVAVVEHDPVPPTQDGEVIEPGALRREGGRVIRAWSIIPVAPADWARRIADRRYQEEIKGCIALGYRFHTDREARALITDAGMWGAIEPSHSRKWKTMDAGFVLFDASQLTQIAIAVNAYAQACFDREAELLDELASGTFVPSMLETGWPT